MSEGACTTPAQLTDLLAYWLGEMGAGAQDNFEAHLFTCTDCGARLERLVQLTKGVRRELREGHLSSVLTAKFIQRLKAAGVRIREYRLHPGGSVNCTVAPEDDLVVGHLQARLLGVPRLDLLLEEGEGGARRRLPDVSFDPSADGVVLAPSTAALRKLGFATLRVELIAVSDESEQVIGSYTFNHSRYR